MQPLHFKVPKLEEETIRVECWDLDNFFEPIHYHEEFQISLILEGEGSLFVAESVVPFKKNEIFLLGKNLPHVFRNKHVNFGGAGHKKSKAVSVFFNQDVLKNSLNEIPEAYSIKRLIDFAIYGVKISDKIEEEISIKLRALPEKNSFERFLGLLDILQCISRDNNLNFISSLGVPIHSVQENLPKINLVFEYIRNHFSERITLKQVSEMVNMSPTAFCRYFKYKSQKTFSRFLIEVRIANACRLLYQDDFNTSECCYSSGYNNLSNFHKHFKSVTGMTPLEYRNNILKKTSVQ
ncbi:AraC family transcriptional regulator [Cyclobacterium sp.]|uniref:AraC family transcriptional regulator n=1 Tax=Cyclobacterium sp. TaxID=1966343 RepID=UPI0019BE92F0|nr:AraC family transcriptional regulator [Cyclobacterium sp.]MBD3630897.1 helix-turn-helix transcriptional regulator [Cyclobacterium sp.]